MTETIANKEIIDATQDAVLNAASSVVNALENTTEAAVAGEPFYMGAEFWVGAAFVIAVSALARPVGKALVAMLKNKAVTIASRISEAVDLKENAQRLLADYERKFICVDKEVAEILSRSEKEIELVRNDALAKLENEMNIKEKEAKARIKASEESASQEIVAQTSDLTMNMVKNVLLKKLDEATTSKMIEDSIKNLGAIK